MASRTLRYVSGSFMVALPSDIVRTMKLQPGQKIDLKLEAIDKLVVRSVGNKLGVVLMGGAWVAFGIGMIHTAITVIAM